MDYWNGTTPVTLAGDAPIAQSIGGLRLALPQLDQFLNRLFLAVLTFNPSKNAELIIKPSSTKASFSIFISPAETPSCNDRYDFFELVLSGQIQIALIVSRAAKDCPATILHQHEIGDINGQDMSVPEGVFRGGYIRPETLFFRVYGRLARPHPIAFFNKRPQRRIALGKF